MSELKKCTKYVPNIVDLFKQMLIVILLTFVRLGSICNFNEQNPSCRSNEVIIVPYGIIFMQIFTKYGYGLQGIIIQMYMNI